LLSVQGGARVLRELLPVFRADLDEVELSVARVGVRGK
jgi:hypothetical protein